LKCGVAVPRSGQPPTPFLPAPRRAHEPDRHALGGERAVSYRQGGVVMSEPRHEVLLLIVRRLPSDFEPWGERSRSEDWGPDCSCGCRWFIPLAEELRYDWGVCYNPKSPRCSLLTFEHQGCREFEAEGILPCALLPRDGGALWLLRGAPDAAAKRLRGAALSVRASLTSTCCSTWSVQECEKLDRLRHELAGLKLHNIT